MSDNRAFGYIYGSPENGHRFFGIKTEKAAAQVRKSYWGWSTIKIGDYSDLISNFSKIGCSSNEGSIPSGF